MKITNSSIETLGVGQSSSLGGPEGASKGGGASHAAKNDSVSLSGASNLVQLAKSSASPSHAAKLASLTAQVRSGQYQADSGEVSQALIQGHLS